MQPNSPDSMPPAQSYFGSFEKKLHEGPSENGNSGPHDLAPRRRTADQQAAEAARHHIGFQFDHSNAQAVKVSDANLRRTTQEEERCHVRPSRQMRQPCRALHADLSPSAFRNFLEDLLSEDNFSLERDIAEITHTAPLWSHCMEYEFQLRSTALKLGREANLPTQKALWEAYV